MKRMMLMLAAPPLDLDGETDTIHPFGTAAASPVHGTIEVVY